MKQTWWGKIRMGPQVIRRERTELNNLEEFVPQDHLLRAVDRYLDLTEFRKHLENFYSHTGPPGRSRADEDDTASIKPGW
jgi:transposase